jgi:ATP-dependent exoDNAse (exonuclease V) beta subunit
MKYVTEFETVSSDVHVLAFVEHITLVVSSGDRGSVYQPSETPDSINILTVHGAKGLEFKYVFVVNLVEERFPTRTRGEAIELPLALIKEQLPEGDFHYQEERRLFYVAVTRARKHLFLTYPMTTGYDTLQFNQPSTFVEEVPPRLFERVELREASGYHTATVRRGSSSMSTGEWNDDSGDPPWIDEPTIQIDHTGERRSAGTKTVWKSATDTPPKKAPGSFLRDVDEL